MKRKILCLILLSIIFNIFVAKSIVYACPNNKSDIGCVLKKRLVTDEIKIDPLHDYIPTEEEMNFLTKPYLSRSTTIWVPVTSPCDQVWRSIYPNNWMWQASRAIANADNMLSNKFGIELYSVAQKYWSSSGNSAEKLVSEAKKEWGLTNGAKLMIAFSGKKDGYIMGKIYDIGTPYILILEHQYENNRETVQHEVGHAYGLKHIDGDNDCVMTAEGMGHIDTICSTHELKWRNSKNRY